MIDVNNSQNYDSASEHDFLLEKRGRTILTGGLLAPTDESSEITDPIAFLKANYPNEQLFRFILTHPDMDHMRGLKRVHDEIGITNFWDTAHTKPDPEFRSDEDKVDWEFYRELRGGKRGLTPKNYLRGTAVFAFAKEENGMDGGDGIEILSPTSDLVAACNATGRSNDLSYVLRLSFANTKIIFPGDAEEEAWATMVGHYGARLKSDFLKASHHGRDSGYYLDAVKTIAPTVTIVSVGRKPDTDASTKYKQFSGSVRSTRYHGNISLHIEDNGDRHWYVDRNADK